MSFGVVLLAGLYLVLAAVALARRDAGFGRAVGRTVEQLLLLAPRVIMALLAAGFIAKLIPGEVIGRYLGDSAGVAAVATAYVVGMIIPAGPVIAFSIAAVFARAGASTPALVTFVTAWSIFAAHRIIIYEIPLLGPSFVRLRLLSTVVLPLLAGMIAMAAFAIAGEAGDANRGLLP